MESNQQQVPGNQRVRIPVKSVMARYRSKREIYSKYGHAILTSYSFVDFLTIDCHIYLPPYITVTIYFCKDLINGKKKKIKNDQVHHITIPQYEGLGIKEICNFLMKHPSIGEWLPDMIVVPRLPKEFLGNVAFTVLGDVFGDWVKQQIESRNEKVLVERNNAIEMDPEMAEAFNRSTAVSSK